MGSGKFFMVTFLDTIGLKDWAETQETVQLMFTLVKEFGKVIPGYSGEFHCAYMEFLELVFHVESDRGIVTGFSMHFPCNDIWNLVSTGIMICDERADRLSKCLRFNKIGVKDEEIPVRIICADVLPCYSAGEKISMAVAAFPIEIHYYPNEEAWELRQDKRIMNEVVDFAGNIHGWYTDLTVIKGSVKSISVCSSRNVKKEQKFFYCVTVETDFGDIGIYHERNFIGETEREFIREGAYVFASCVIQGDVAIGRYENGAVYDEWHCLKLLKDCFETGDFFRLRRALAEKVSYFDADLGKEIHRNEGNAIEDLQFIKDSMKVPGRASYAYLGTVDDYRGKRTDDCIPLGTNILAIATVEPMNLKRLVSIKLNAENKIERITTASIKDYRVIITKTAARDLRQ